MPIVGWGTDYRWDGTAWALKPKRSQYRPEDEDELLRNVSGADEGPDGLVVFVRPDELGLTVYALLATRVHALSGAEELSA